MIIQECVVAILGAFEGIYPMRTLTLFRWDRKVQNYRIMAASGESNTRSTNYIRNYYPRLSLYVKSTAGITKVGNLYEICPGKVLVDDCERVYPNLSGMEYQVCLNYANNKIKAIILPPETTKERLMMMQMEEITMRNILPLNTRCLERLQKRKYNWLSKLPVPCTDAIIRDLMYQKKIKLIGNFNCDGVEIKSLVFLNADRPLVLSLDTPHMMFRNKKGFHMFTTDGTRIIHLFSEVGAEGMRLTNWVAYKEILPKRSGMISILDAIKKERATEALFEKSQDTLSINLEYKDCYL